MVRNSSMLKLKTMILHLHFSYLSFIYQLLEEMKNSTHTDIDKCVLTNLRKLSDQIVEKAPNTDFKQMLKLTLASCETEVERNGVYLLT